MRAQCCVQLTIITAANSSTLPQPPNSWNTLARTCSSSSSRNEHQCWAGPPLAGMPTSQHNNSQVMLLLLWKAHQEAHRQDPFACVQFQHCLAAWLLLLLGLLLLLLPQLLRGMELALGWPQGAWVLQVLLLVVLVLPCCGVVLELLLPCRRHDVGVSSRQAIPCALGLLPPKSTPYQHRPGLLPPCRHAMPVCAVPSPGALCCC